MIVLQTLGVLDLRDDAGGEASRVLAQPKRLALLGYLAITAVPQRRDTLLALFWPELDDRRARLALRQAVHFLRRALGADTLRRSNGDELALGEGLRCDVGEFERALQEGRHGDALLLYGGELLPGFHCSEAAPEFGQWLDDVRQRLQAGAAEAAWLLADAAEQAGSPREAIRRGHQALQFAPDDETGVRRLISLLDRLDDRSGALRAYDESARRLKQEFGVDPAAETVRLIETVRSHQSPPPVVAPVGDAAGMAHPLPQAAPAMRPVRHRRPVLLAANCFLILVLLAGWLISADRRGDPRESARTVAHRLYQEALRAYQAGEWRGANQLFLAALEEDSTFALAAYYAARSVRSYRVDSEFVLLELAARLSSRAPERDRLIIRSARQVFDHPSRVLAAAESLASRHPRQPEGYIALARARHHSGDFAGAIGSARAAIARFGQQAPTPDCLTCDAYELLLNANLALGSDSLPAVERIAREWIEYQPGSSRARELLATALTWRGQPEAAVQSLIRAAQLQPWIMPRVIFERAVIQGERYAEAERLLRERLQFDERDWEAIWWLVTTLRHQGRLTEALAVLQQAPRHPSQVEAGALAAAEAQVTFEQGRFAEAAGRFEALTRWSGPTDAAYVAHQFTWPRIHAAAAWAAAGDTVRLAALSGAIDGVAHLSSTPLHHRLPHHLHGLLWLARGQPARAAEAFQAAIFSPTLGYTRANLELARVLVTLGRSREAIPVLRDVLVVTPDGTGYYLTRTEVHEWLARSFEAAALPDSAAAHYRLVAEAWRLGDGPYRTRAEAARRKLLELPHLDPSLPPDVKVRQEGADR
jgi:DNA-binding SARP family transcriptional activator/thioredoxin-like negative regulator of GroEL